jgi:peroxin-16
MEQIKQAAAHTKVVVKLPTKWLSMYGDFITKNAGAVGQVEGALRSITYLVPGSSYNWSRTTPMLMLRQED